MGIVLAGNHPNLLCTIISIGIIVLIAFYTCRIMTFIILNYTGGAEKISGSLAKRESEGVIWSCHVSGASSGGEDQLKTWPYEPPPT